MEPKTYVAGSSKDPKAGSGSLVYAVTAGVIGAAAIAAGVSLTAQESRELMVYFFCLGERSCRFSAPFCTLFFHSHGLSFVSLSFL